MKFQLGGKNVKIGGRSIRINDWGFDKKLGIYRKTIKGEFTRGAIIQNPKKIFKRWLPKLKMRF